MKFFVTGVGGQLGHDVMNELISRGHVGVGSDIQPQYAGIADGSAVTTAEYRQLDITDEEAVRAVIFEVNPDAVIHCAAWTAVDAAEDEENIPKVRAINAGGTQNIAGAVKALNEMRAGENHSVCLQQAPPLTGEASGDSSQGSPAGGRPFYPRDTGAFDRSGAETGTPSGVTEGIAFSGKPACKMTYISTDYVFNGQGTIPWEPDCKDYAPLNVYGQTKLEGELAVSSTLDQYFIVRIAWVFGLNGKNFIKTMLNVGRKYDTVRVVNDQIGTPTYTYDLARLLTDMNETEKYGYYHATNEGGYISWYDFTKEIYRQANELLTSAEKKPVEETSSPAEREPAEETSSPAEKKPVEEAVSPAEKLYTTKVVPVTTEEYGLSKAARPFNSRLEKKKLAESGFKPLPTWQDALSRYLKALKENGDFPV